MTFLYKADPFSLEKIATSKLYFEIIRTKERQCMENIESIDNKQCIDDTIEDSGMTFSTESTK